MRISQNHSSPTGNNKKPIFLNGKPLKNRKLGKNYFRIFRNIFLMKVSGRSHSAEKLEKSFTLAKGFVACKN